MNLYSKIAREIIENGEVELRIRIGREVTFGELEEKLSILLSAFPSEQIKIVSITELRRKEELEVLEVIA